MQKVNWKRELNQSLNVWVVYMKVSLQRCGPDVGIWNILPIIYLQSWLLSRMHNPFAVSVLILHWEKKYRERMVLVTKVPPQEWVV